MARVLWTASRLSRQGSAGRWLVDKRKRCLPVRRDEWKRCSREGLAEEEAGEVMIDLCELPMPGKPQFSSPVERVIWLLRHQDEPLAACWWLGFEFAQKERSFERVVWEMTNNIDKYVPKETQ